MNLYNFFWTSKSVKRNQVTSKYEPVQPFLFISLIKYLKCEVVFDIGANIGFYSLLSSLGETVKSVHAFEAVHEPYQEMTKNIEMNDLQKRVFSHNLAVSNENADITFLINRDPLSGINASKCSTFHDEKKYSYERNVKAIMLDDFCDFTNKSIAFKIDVEGHELAVIEGAEDLLKNNKCFIQVECFEKNRELLSSKIESMGYHAIYELHNDIYFANSETLKDFKNISEVVKNSLNLLVKNNLSKFPDKIDSNKWLSGSIAMLGNDKLKAGLVANKSYFSGGLEYAFHLLVGGAKKETVWYTNKDYVEFNVPSGIDLHSISIRGFVREKKYPDKKVYIDIKFDNNSTFRDSLTH